MSEVIMTNAQRVRALAIARENGGGHAPCRWAWPNERNCWNGKSARRGPGQAYSGPSKRTVAKRASRRATKRSH